MADTSATQYPKRLRGTLSSCGYSSREVIAQTRGRGRPRHTGKDTLSTADNQLCSQRGTECGTLVTLSNQAAVPFRIRSIAVTLQFNRAPACAKTKLAETK